MAASALYVGFAMVNWMAKGNLLGGIYNRHNPTMQESLWAEG
jgi:hypothetical protein